MQDNKIHDVNGKRHMDLDVGVKALFEIYDSVSKSKWYVDSWNDFLRYLENDLPGLDGDFPGVLFISASFKTVCAFDNITKQKLDISQMKGGDTIFGQHPNKFIQNAGFYDNDFRARVIVSPDGKIPIVASLSKMQKTCSDGPCDKCQDTSCFAKQPENQGVPAIYSGGRFSMLKPVDFQPLDDDNLPKPHSFIINRDGILIHGAPGYEVTKEGYPKNLYDFFTGKRAPVNIQISVCHIMAQNEK